MKNNFAALVAFGFVLGTYWLTQVFDQFWIITVFASVVLGNLVCLAWNASRIYGHKPLLYGSVGALLVLIGITNPESEPLRYAGLLALGLVSAWHSWPRKSPRTKKPCCQ